MEEGYNIIAGINVNTQCGGSCDFGFIRGKNSFVITSLDHLLDETEKLLSMAREQRRKRDSQSSEQSARSDE